MTSTKSILIAVCLAGLLLIVNPGETVQAQGRAEKPLRVLIDASKDGGVWWFPQHKTFDQKQKHQGKIVADFLRGQGWEVTELPRGEVITFEKLRDTDVVVRVPAYYSYTPDELLAYEASVAAGTRVLLLCDGNRNDSLAHMFGLRFESLSRFGSVRQWVRHPLTAGLKKQDLTWTSISEAPSNAVLLAWLGLSETNPRPVLGYLTYGKGYLVFVGQALVSRHPNHSFAAGLVNTILHHTPEEIRQHSMAVRRVPEEPLESLPRLLEPAPDATLPQREIGAWRFDWEDDPAAKGYELVVLGPAAVFPIVNTVTTSSEYVVPARDGYIADHNLLGWSWRVRSQYLNGTWGPWSRVRRFNVSPRIIKAPN